MTELEKLTKDLNQLREGVASLGLLLVSKGIITFDELKQKEDYVRSNDVNKYLDEHNK